jgi:hypothetical protein
MQDTRTMAVASVLLLLGRGAPKKGATDLQPPPQPETPKNLNLKNTNFVDIVISNVLIDFPFSGNQPLKSAGD